LCGLRPNLTDRMDMVMAPIPSDDQKIIADVIKREGGVSNDPADRGSLTYEGISSISNPDLFKNGLPSDAQVRQRYEEKYIMGPGFNQITDSKVKSLLVDWGVNSGPAIAIKNLQAILHVDQDGILGAETAQAANSLHPEDLVNSLVAKRVQMIGRLITNNPSQAKFAAGWLNRAVEWLG
jgi:lysozyme family protein